MFTTSGFFRGLNCPHYACGQGRTCRRPYCHFRHVRRDPGDNQSSTSFTAAAGKKQPANQSSKTNDGAKKSDYRSTSLPNWKKKKPTIGRIPRRDHGALSVNYIPTPPLLQKKQVPPRPCDFDNPFGKSSTETEEYDPTNAALGSTSQKYSLDTEDHEDYSPLGGGYDPLQNSNAVEKESTNKYTAEPDVHDSMEYDPTTSGAEVEEKNKYAIDGDGPVTDLEYDPLVNSSLEAVNPEKYFVPSKCTDEEYDPLEGQSSNAAPVKYSNEQSDIGTLYGVDEYDPLESSGGNVVDYIPSSKETYLVTSSVEPEEYIPTVNYSPLKRKASTDVCVDSVKKLKQSKVSDDLHDWGIKQSKENGDDDDLHNWDMDAWFSEDEDEDVQGNKRRRDDFRKNKRQAKDESSDEDEALVIDLYDDIPSVDKDNDDRFKIIEIEDENDDHHGIIDVQNQDENIDKTGVGDEEGGLVISEENVSQDTSDANQNNEVVKEVVKEPSQDPAAVEKPRVSSEQLADFFTKRLQQPVKNKVKKKRVNSGENAFKSVSMNKNKTDCMETESTLTEQNNEKKVEHDEKPKSSEQSSEKTTGNLEKKVDDKKNEKSTSESGKRIKIDGGQNEFSSNKVTSRDDKKSTTGEKTKSMLETVDQLSKGQDKTTSSEYSVKKSNKELNEKSMVKDSAEVLKEETSSRQQSELMVKEKSDSNFEGKVLSSKTSKSDVKEKKDKKSKGKISTSKTLKTDLNEKNNKKSEGKNTISKTSTEKTNQKPSVQNRPSSIKDDNIFSKLAKSANKVQDDRTNTPSSEVRNDKQDKEKIVQKEKEKTKSEISRAKENGNISKRSVSKGTEHGNKERRMNTDEVKQNKDSAFGVDELQVSKNHRSNVDKSVPSSNKEKVSKKLSAVRDTVKCKNDERKQSKTSEKDTMTKDEPMKTVNINSKQQPRNLSSKIENCMSKPSHTLQRSNSLKKTSSSDRKIRTQSTDGASKTLKKHITSEDLFGSLSSESSEDVSSSKKDTSLMKVLDSANTLNKKVAIDIYELSSSSDEMFHISKQVKEDFQKWDRGLLKSKNEPGASAKDVYDLSSDSSDVDSIQRIEKVEALKKRYAEMMRKVEEQEREAAEMRRAAEAQLKQCETIICKRKSTSDNRSKSASSRRYSEQELFGDSSGDEVENNDVILVGETSKDDIKPDVIDLLSSDESDCEHNASRKMKVENLKVKKEKMTAIDVKQELLKKSNTLDSKHKKDDNKADKHQSTKPSSSRSDHKSSKISSKSSSSKSFPKEKTSSSKDKYEKQKRSGSISTDKSSSKPEHKSSKDKTRVSSKDKTRRPSKDKSKESSKESDESFKRKSSSKESDESLKRKSSSKDASNKNLKVCDKLKASTSRTKTVCDKTTKHKSSSSTNNKTDKSGQEKTEKGENKRAIETSKRKRKNSEMCVTDDCSDIDDNHVLSDADIPEDYYLNDTDISFSETDTYDECLRIFNEEIVQPLNDAKKKETLSTPDELEEVPAVSFGRKRVAHEPKFNLGKMRKTPKKPKAQPSPAQVCHNRFFQAHQEALKTMKHDPPPQRVPTEFPRPSAEKKRVAHTPKGLDISSHRASSSISSPSKRISHSTSSSPSAPFVSPKQRIIEKKYSSVNRANSGWEIPGKTLATTADKGGKRVAHVPTKVSPRPVIPIGHGGKIPSVVRQRYLNLFIDEYLKTCDTEKEAFDHALKEEQAIHDRASSKSIYLNLSINYLKKLRNATADPSAPGPSSPPPKNAVSHSAVIGGKGAALHSFTLHRSAGKLEDHGVYHGKQLYEKLKPYVLTSEQLWENGFPRSGVIPGQAEVKEDDRLQKTLSTADPNQKVCARCGKSFLRRPDGIYITKESCTYHWGKLWRQKVGGILEHRFSCCSGDSESKGCCLSKLHVTEDKTENLSGFMKTHSKTPPRDGSPGVFALDCEMCYTVKGMELTRVTVINDKLQQVYDSLVKPDNDVVDYNTRFSGITEHDLKTVDTKLHNVQAVLLNMFSSETILLGHSLESDLLSLKMVHNNVVDTSVVFPHKLGPPYKRALRTLMADFMKKLIQQDEGGHDSMEDAKSCMELMIWKLKEDAKTKR